MIEQATSFRASSAAESPDFKVWRNTVKQCTMRLDPESRTAGPMPVFGNLVRETILGAQNSHAYAPSAQNVSQPQTDIVYNASNEEDFSFGDVIDVINPLQHLPVIGTLYRKLTGDTIKPMGNIIGGAIFGGPVGAVASTLNVVVKSTTGRDIAENAFAIAGFDLSTPAPAAPTLVYETAPAGRATNTSKLANANLPESSAYDIYRAADGRRNFAAQNTSTQNWNA